jgi:diguanylate cyclase
MSRLSASLIPGLAGSTAAFDLSHAILCCLVLALLVTVVMMMKIRELRKADRVSNIEPGGKSSADASEPAGPVSDSEKEVLASSKEAIQTLLKNLSGFIHELVQHNIGHSEALRAYRDTVKDATSTGGTGEVQDPLLREIDSMLETGDQYRETLKNANVQIRSQQEAMEQILVDSSLDFLTRLHNRRIFDLRLKEEISRTKRYGKPFVLIMLDIDNFKRVNDNHGHPVGDRVLQLIAQTMEAQVRMTDFVARFGGEEFAILLPEANGKQGMAVADKIRLAVSGNPLKCGDSMVSVTISAGTTEIDPENDTMEILIDRADKALYRAKHMGRNRVELIVADY